MRVMWIKYVDEVYGWSMWIECVDVNGVCEYYCSSIRLKAGKAKAFHGKRQSRKTAQQGRRISTPDRTQRETERSPLFL